MLAGGDRAPHVDELYNGFSAYIDPSWQIRRGRVASERTEEEQIGN